MYACPFRRWTRGSLCQVIGILWAPFHLFLNSSANPKEPIKSITANGSRKTKKRYANPPARPSSEWLSKEPIIPTTKMEKDKLNTKPIIYAHIFSRNIPTIVINTMKANANAMTFPAKFHERNNTISGEIAVRRKSTDKAIFFTIKILYYRSTQTENWPYWPVSDCFTIWLTKAPSALPFVCGIKAAITLPMSCGLCAPVFAMASLTSLRISSSPICSGK